MVEAFLAGNRKETVSDLKTLAEWGEVVRRPPKTFSSQMP